jgi:hypothetical protein
VSDDPKVLSQVAALAMARKELEGHGGGVAHYFGRKLIPHSDDECRCTDQPLRPAVVVFHDNAIRLTAGGHFCPDCGQTLGVVDTPGVH